MKRARSSVDARCPLGKRISQLSRERGRFQRVNRQTAKTAKEPGTEVDSLAHLLGAVERLAPLYVAQILS
jgi:hypothetical protein